MCVESLCVGKHKEATARARRWEPPQEGWLKVNVDGAYSESSGEGGIGVIIRDHAAAVQLSSWQWVRGAGDT